MYVNTKLSKMFILILKFASKMKGGNRFPHLIPV